MKNNEVLTALSEASTGIAVNAAETAASITEAAVDLLAVTPFQ